MGGFSRHRAHAPTGVPALSVTSCGERPAAIRAHRRRSAPDGGPALPGSHHLGVVVVMAGQNRVAWRKWLPWAAVFAFMFTITATTLVGHLAADRALRASPHRWWLL